MTANFILGLVTGLPIGLSLGYLLMAAIAHQRRKAAERAGAALVEARTRGWDMAQGLYTPRNNEPTELDQ